MVIERDRYLDDGSQSLLTLGLRSRTPAMHSLLSALDDDERQAVGQSIAHALDEIAGLLVARRARAGGA